MRYASNIRVPNRFGQSQPLLYKLAKEDSTSSSIKSQQAAAEKKTREEVAARRARSTESRNKKKTQEIKDKAKKDTNISVSDAIDSATGKKKDTAPSGPLSRTTLETGRPEAISLPANADYDKLIQDMQSPAKPLTVDEFQQGGARSAPSGEVSISQAIQGVKAPPTNPRYAKPVIKPKMEGVSASQSIAGSSAGNRYILDPSLQSPVLSRYESLAPYDTFNVPRVDPNVTAGMGVSPLAGGIGGAALGGLLGRMLAGKDRVNEYGEREDRSTRRNVGTLLGAGAGGVAGYAAMSPRLRAAVKAMFENK